MVDVAAPQVATPVRQPLFSDGYKRAVLATLTLCYTLNFIDRTIIGIIGQPMKESLGMTDAQLGLLGGLGFALLYTLLGVPIARIAERVSRVNVMAVCITVWSGFTALCGLAPNFAAMFAMRIGVGIGEAGCSPPAHSLISDYYEPKRRASALSVYAFGIPLGGMLGAVLGGLIAQYLNWRMAFFVVGLPGVLVALALKLIVKEPPRGHSEIEARPALPEDVTPEEAPAPARSFVQEMRHEVRELGAVAWRIFGTWSFLNMALGVTLASFAGYGAGQFASPYFIRAFGLGLALVGGLFGVIGGFSSGAGTLVGGFVTDWLSKRSAAWYALVPGIGLMLAVPIYLVAYTRLDWRVAAWILLLPGIFQYTYLGPTFGVIQNAVDQRRRATATAVLFLFLNLIALGGGPAFTGWLIDQFGQFNFTHAGSHSIMSSLSRIFLHGEAVGGQFADLCPGGLPRKGVATTLTAACKPTLVRATREGLIVVFFFYAWGGLHYFLAALTLAKDLRKAAAERGDAVGAPAR
ncbi:MAG TPA: MFS transporter [Caulobacteraceae bacterium]|nr:MFS transporter [Caulobacteraceae bacterium]